MAIKVLALASGVTGLADHRELIGSLLTSAGTTAVRSGVLPGLGAGNLTTVSAMVARVAPVKVAIANGVSAALGPYILVSDANVDITFAAGEASVVRTDRIIARAYDNTNDGSGSTTGAIEYLKGQASGTATALPTNSVLLYEMPIPAGASAGGGGVNFANAVDQRVYTAANGGIFPVASNTAMAAISSPWEGMAVYRTDIDVLYIYDGTNFKARGQANVSSSANLSTINNPYDGMVAVTRDTDAIYVYNGSSWVAPKVPFTPTGRIRQTAAQTGLVDATIFAVTFDVEDFDTHNFHSTSSNTSRVTPTVAGYYQVDGVVCAAAQSDYVALDAIIRTNGTTSQQGATRITPSAVSTTSAIPVSAKVLMNGTTDYFEVTARFDRSGNGNSATAVSAFLGSTLEWTYIGPTSY